MKPGTGKSGITKPLPIPEAEETRPLPGREGVRASAYLGRIEKLAEMEGAKIWEVLRGQALEEATDQDAAFLYKVVFNLKIYCAMRRYERDPEGLSFMFKAAPDRKMTDFIRKTVFAYLLKNLRKHPLEDDDSYDFFRPVFAEAFTHNGRREKGFIDAIELIQAEVEHDTNSEKNSHLLNNVRLLTGANNAYLVEITAVRIESICREAESIFKHEYPDVTAKIKRLRDLKDQFKQADPMSTKKPIYLEVKPFTEEYSGSLRVQMYRIHFYNNLIGYLADLLENFSFEDAPTLPSVSPPEVD